MNGPRQMWEWLQETTLPMKTAQTQVYSMSVWRNNLAFDDCYFDAVTILCIAVFNVHQDTDWPELHWGFVIICLFCVYRLTVFTTDWLLPDWTFWPRIVQTWPLQVAVPVVMSQSTFCLITYLSWQRSLLQGCWKLTWLMVILETQTFLLDLVV